MYKLLILQFNIKRVLMSQTTLSSLFCNNDFASKYWQYSRVCHKVRSRFELNDNCLGFFCLFIYCISLNPRPFHALRLTAWLLYWKPYRHNPPDAWFFRPWCYIAHGSRILLLWYNLIKDRCMNLSYTRLNWRIF